MILHAMTAIGQRPNNEDTVLLGHEVFVDDALETREGDIAAVLDGVGGSPRGEEASLAGAKSLAANYRPDMSEEEFRECLYQAHKAVHGLQKLDANGPFSTLVGIAKLKDGYYGFNLGDSIALRFSGGKLKQISRDDSTAPGLYEFGVKIHGYITYCLGQSNLTPEDFHIEPLDLSPGDVVLITSDGITNTVPFRDLERILGDSFDGEEQFNAIKGEAERLGPSDNYSMVLCEL